MWHHPKVGVLYRVGSRVSRGEDAVLLVDEGADRLSVAMENV